MNVSIDDAMTVGAAALLLRVSEKQVQHLGRTGQVTYVARGLLDASSVRARQAARQGSHTRAWSGATAWAAIALLSGRAPEWTGQAQCSRLRSRLRGMDASDLIAASRNRASAERFAGHDAGVRRLLGDRRTVARRVLPGLVGNGQQSEAHVYVASSAVSDLVATLGLAPAVRGNIVLRVVPADTGVSIVVVEALMGGEALPALDAAVSDDPRERGQALRLLDQVLGRFRDDA